MIDPHVHLRDWGEAHKMTLEKGLILAQIHGFRQVFEMPNTKPPITSRDLALKRIEDANNAIEKNGLSVEHCLYLGLTSEPSQVREVVDTYYEFFPRVVGLKLYCAATTGDLKVTDKYSQYEILKSLSGLKYQGVLAVHCEEEELFKPEQWNPNYPSSHNDTRPLESEYYSIKNIIYSARLANFRGNLHICHISNPKSIGLINSAKNNLDYKITCGITPHHALYSTEYMDALEKDQALMLKVNPPIRDGKSQEQLFQSILDGKVDFIETDFAPHTIEEKTNPEMNNPYASGIADFSMHGRLLDELRAQGLSSNEIWKLTDYNIVETFGLRKLI